MSATQKYSPFPGIDARLERLRKSEKFSTMLRTCGLSERDVRDHQPFTPQDCFAWAFARVPPIEEFILESDGTICHPPNTLFILTSSCIYTLLLLAWLLRSAGRSRSCANQRAARSGRQRPAPCKARMTNL